MSNSTKSVNTIIQEEFALAVTNFLMQTSQIQTSNRICHFALKVATPQLAAQDQQSLSVLKQTVPVVGDVLKDIEKNLGDAGIKILAKGMTETSLTNAARNLDAAAIVFCHSLLDAVLFTLCSICHRIAPNDWVNFIKEQRIKVNELAEKSKDDLLFDKSKMFLEQLERESLAVKANTLCALCKPPANPEYVKNYSFSLSELEKFDSARIGIVHHKQFRKPIHGVEPMMVFAQKTGLYFSAMIAKKYELQMLAGSDFWNKIRAELA